MLIICQVEIKSLTFTYATTTSGSHQDSRYFSFIVISKILHFSCNIIKKWKIGCGYKPLRALGLKGMWCEKGNETISFKSRCIQHLGFHLDYKNKQP